MIQLFQRFFNTILRYLRLPQYAMFPGLLSISTFLMLLYVDDILYLRPHLEISPWLHF